MGELQKISQSSGLTLFNQGQTKAIDTRLRMAEMPEVIQALTPIERRMFEASIKTPVADFSDEELTHKVGLIVKYISRDAGIKSVDDYELARFMTVLKLYYSLFSLQEIRMAFELAIIGELDEFLPRDKDGRPDKNHYQTFNIEYVSKILNAYKKRFREIEYKSYTIFSQLRSQQISPEIKAYYIREMKRTVIVSFLSYKYRGKLPDNVNSFLIYAEIERLGLAEPIQVTEADKKEAVARLLRKTHTGVIKEFVGECIRHLQTKHSDVIAEAGLIAKEKALIKSFEVMTKEEIQITDYITLK